jgi:23S rRNA (adenine2503-C2)-methyltransferase
VAAAAIALLSTQPSNGLSNSVIKGDAPVAASLRAAANGAGGISPLSLSFEELSQVLGGTGRAKACWDCFRMGVDPVWYYSKLIDDNDMADDDGKCDDYDESTYIPEEEPVNYGNNAAEATFEDVAADPSSTTPLLKGWNHRQIREKISTTTHWSSKSSRRARGGSNSNGLGRKTIDLLRGTLGGNVERDVATLSKITTCTDGTTKLLLQLASDGLSVETVIIPWPDRESSTVCVSSQVGCRQACTFCSTGRMGKLRSLTSSEILAQLYWANKVCRIMRPSSATFPIDNCVFMGMGEPADNVPAVVQAAQIMVDRRMFRLAPRRVTISTVAPCPQAFSELGGGAAAPVVLAWSVHSSRDVLRRQLVPTTRHTMEDLRDGLVRCLQGRTKRLRSIMLEVTLLDGINDSPHEDAVHLANFCKPLLDAVDGIKLVVNLIPWNDIDASFGPASTYRPPQTDRVLAYQKVLVQNGILCYVRTTRGDEENAACGMLSTRERKKRPKEENEKSKFITTTL